MPELVAHEVEVAVACRSGSHKAYELVQGNSAVHNQILAALVHGPVHLLVNKAEDYGLVANQGLIVALGIAYGLLVGALVGEFPPDFAHGPLLVSPFLNPLDPVISHAHGHAIVKAYSACGQRRSESGHTADILGYGDGVRIEFMDQHVGECQVADGIFVHPLVEIKLVVAEIGAQAVIPVKH